MRLKVYYLDDEADLCENFSDFFTSEQVQVTTFVDPKVAIDAIRNNPPDLLFVDYRLPGTTGDELAKTVDPKIPKFLITGENFVKTECNFEKVLNKPYKVSDILQIISNYVATKSSS